MTPGKKVSIIVCTLNRPSLMNCLKSIYNQTYKKIEIVIVSPNKNVVKTISDIGHTTDNIKFLISDKANVSRQRNIGIRHTTGKIVGFIDDDAIADKNWVSNLMVHYDDEEVMCVGGKIVPKLLDEVPEELKNLPKYIYKGFLGETFLEFERPTVIDRPLLWGSNISFRKEVFEIIGEFDEELGKSSDKPLCEEEIDIQTKILKKGYKIVYDPRSIVTHLIDSKKLTKDYFIKRSFWQGFSEVIKTRKYEKFQNKLDELKLSQLEYINSIKLLELIFKLSTDHTLEENVKTSYKIGRITALSHLIRR